MKESLGRVHVDVGGGRDARYFLKLAAGDPCNTYIVLDPVIKKRPECSPKNLLLFQWGSAENFAFPFQNHSVDFVSANFMYGQFRGDDLKNLQAIKDTMENDYRVFLRNAKEVLEREGRLIVVETQYWMSAVVQRLVAEEGFTIARKPSRYPDEDRTQWSKYSSINSTR